MPSHVLLLSAGAFLAVLGLGFGLSRLAADDEARRLRRRLQELGPARPGEDDALDIVLDVKYSAIPPLDGFLRRLPWARSIQLLLLQGDTRLRVGAFLLLVLALAAAGAATALLILDLPAMALPAAVLLGAVPFGWARRRKGLRVRHFERQFPDALDILTGALRSGLAFTGAIQVVAEECGEPVSAEFTTVFEQTRLGVDMRHALKGLADRVDSKELHLFVIAVLLQRETGGNLAEVLDGTANVIRERLRILGDVRALTAQARLSAGILSILPLGLGLFILATAPDYLAVLLREDSGRWLLAGAAAMQIVGFLLMRRIAQIKV
jgi:tight adherence protein B